MGVFIEICRIISYSFLIYFQSFHFMPHIKKSHSLCYEILFAPLIFYIIPFYSIYPSSDGNLMSPS